MNWNRHSRQALISGIAYGLGLIAGNILGFFLSSVVAIPRAQSEFTTLLIGLLIAFLIWAVVDRISMKSREARPLPGAPESPMNDVIIVVVGLALYGAFAFWLHEFLFGLRPFA